MRTAQTFSWDLELTDDEADVLELRIDAVIVEYLDEIGYPDRNDGWDDACRCGHVRSSHQQSVARCTICPCEQFDGSQRD